MKKWIIAAAVVALLAGGAYLVLGGGLPPLSASEPSAQAQTPIPVVKAVSQVVAEAKVVPVQYATLSLPSGGVVSQLLVAEGDSVQAGQTLLRLADAEQVAAVAQAQAGLQRAQAQWDDLNAGPQPQQIAAAEATLEAARARLAQLTQSVRAEQIAAAQANLDAAQAALNKTLQDPDEEHITLAAADLRRAEVALQQAQWAYDQVAYAADVAASPQAAHLEQATLNYQSAVASYQLALRPATPAEVAAAQAQLAQAHSALALLTHGPSQPELDAAQAEIHRAQAQLDLLQAPPRPHSLAAAQADLAAAQAALEQARAALAHTELRAHFAGTVAALHTQIGEQVAPGNPLVRLADLSSWRIQTQDLTELDVVRIKHGLPVTITVDALPNLELSGQVLRIKPLGEDRHGDITYSVLIQPYQQDARLRWNMTSAVFIQPHPTQDLAQVPRNPH